MKKLFYALSLFTALNANGQETKLNFSYDNEGNQIMREIVFQRENATAKDSLVKLETIAEQEMIPADVENTLSYYPNPVSEELYLKWGNQDQTFVNGIEVYSLSGQSIQKIDNLKGANSKAVPFSRHPAGFYNVIVVYSNGEKKTLKIVKK